MWGRLLVSIGEGDELRLAVGGAEKGDRDRQLIHGQTSGNDDIGKTSEVCDVGGPFGWRWWRRGRWCGDYRHRGTCRCGIHERIDMIFFKEADDGGLDHRH